MYWNEKGFLFSILSLFLVSLSSGFASINSHSNKLVLKHLSKDYVDSGVCLQQKAVCTSPQNLTCFGTTLPYTSTSIALAEDSISQLEVQDNLEKWQGLRSVPRCWAVIQPLLCGVYMPKCENSSVFLPSQEMCRITRGPCKSVEVKHAWPSFLRCENKKLFPPRCRNPLQEVKFNTTYKCVPPLVETDNPDNWYYEVEGCGIQCQDPFFTKEEHDRTHLFILIFASICFVTNIFSVLTFVVSWKAANRYPGVIVFYINVCLAIVSFGWLIQFFPGAREEIVCSHDGTIRRKQPRSGAYLCSITFVLTYFFLMAAVVWFVILTYAWFVLFKQKGTLKDIKKKKSYFLISACCIPLVLTTAVIAMTGVDGDSMSGICFVGYANMDMRIEFLLAPIGLAGVIGGYFLTHVLCTLIRKKVRQMILKIGMFPAFGVVFIICTFACHAYDFLNRKDWDESLREYIICLAMNAASSHSSIGDLPKCQLKSKPSFAVVCINLFCLFGFGIIMSLCTWTRESLESWKQFFYRLCEPAEKNSVALKGHQLAKDFQKGHEINQGRISLSLNSTHDDPVGMNLDANSVASRDISSTWAAALPQFLVQKNAVAAVVPFVPRHYSSASDMSRHISMDSFNQPNLDSLSMQISEQEFVANAIRHQRRKTRKERERLLRANRIAPWFPGNRRGSDTSLQSSLMAASIAAAAKKAGVGATVTKATSTGDLGIIPPSWAMPFPPVMMPPVNNRPQIQRQPINPPFTHGMTDNSHRLDGRVPSVASVLPGATSSQRFTPCPVVPNSFMGMVRHPLYGGSYDLLNSMQFGYVGGGMYPSLNGMYPGYPFNPEYMYNAYNTLPYGAYNPCNNQYQQDILPMHPMVDSASEAEFFPIRMSDSEYTDTGHRSYDESQLMTAHRLMQEHLQTQNVAAAAAAASTATSTQPKPGLEPQACAKTQFLKRMGSCNSKMNSAVQQTSRPPSGRKSPHSEAPPPSPVASSKSLNYEEPYDVFDEPTDEQKDVSVSSLPNNENGNVFQRIKSKFRRATSFIQNLEKPEAFELASKPCHSSLDQLSKSSSIKNGSSEKDVLKEKWLHPSEGQSLINGDVVIENVSR